jgi:hypothetical protein
VLKTLPYHASGYGKPRLGKSGDDHPDQEGRTVIVCIRVAWREHRTSATRLAEERSRCSQCSQREHCEHIKHAKRSIAYRRVHGATLGVSPWSTQITHLIVWNYRTVLHSLIVVHSLPLHYRPEQSLNPLSQRLLTKQASKACHINKPGWFSVPFIWTSMASFRCKRP